MPGYAGFGFAEQASLWSRSLHIVPWVSCSTTVRPRVRRQLFTRRVRPYATRLGDCLNVASHKSTTIMSALVSGGLMGLFGGNR
ncbi:hypothetical protein AOQ84DRAFT_164670 [Glonium stellatum]|uniref:Uncharacterized protein n=1 Tax=Glonium stellatum TaxID=574774 RepID=A0A8E2JN78_9PEZI|nr:hypothetical protein AOQ84DRAFT_164670 [Glonium stellatum]